MVLAVQARPIRTRLTDECFHVSKEVLKDRECPALTQAEGRSTYVKSRLNVLHFAGHERLRKVYLRVPELSKEGKAQLPCSVALEDLLRCDVSTAHGRRLGIVRTSMVMKFLSDLLILRPSM